MKQKVYWSSIEYSYESKSSEKQKLKGGFVYAFVKSFDVRQALNKLLSKLKQQGKRPIEIEFISPYDKKTEWENSKQEKHYKILYNEARNSSSVIFDTFYAYEKIK